MLTHKIVVIMLHDMGMQLWYICSLLCGRETMKIFYVNCEKVPSRHSILSQSIYYTNSGHVCVHDLYTYTQRFYIYLSLNRPGVTAISSIKKQQLPLYQLGTSHVL